MVERYIEVDGRHLYTSYIGESDTSNKPTIVFLHEALGSVAQWKDFPKALCAKLGLNSLSYDRPGHGRSDASVRKRDISYMHHEAWTVLPAVLEHFEIRDPILWGHSDGGSIALLYASRFPATALVVEAAHVFVESVTLDGIRSAGPRKDFLIDRLRRYHGDKTEDLWNSWADTWLDESFAEWNIEAELSNIECPALIIQGEEDEYGTREQVDRIADAIGDKAEILMVPYVAHTPHREAKDIVLEASVEFLNKYV